MEWICRTLLEYVFHVRHHGMSSNCPEERGWGINYMVICNDAVVEFVFSLSRYATIVATVWNEWNACLQCRNMSFNVVKRFAFRKVKVYFTIGRRGLVIKEFAEFSMSWNSLDCNRFVLNWNSNYFHKIFHYLQ